MFEPISSGNTGGTTLGNSYLSAWAKCPRYWYNHYYRKEPLGGQVNVGLKPVKTSIPLLTGTAVHEGLAAWYKSGVRNGEDTGEYDDDAGIDGAEAALRIQQREYPCEADYVMDQARVLRMLREYFEDHGKGGVNQDFPDIRVMCDPKGEPLVECEFRFELDPGLGAWYTGRLDAIVLHRGQPKILEHKTTSAYGIRPRMNGLNTDSQFSGELWLLQKALEESTPAGEQVPKVAGTLVNILVKDRSKNSKYGPSVRETTTRTEAQLERWNSGCNKILQDIEISIRGFENDMSKGVSLQVAEDLWFPDHGTRHGVCTAYNGQCDFYDLCEFAGMEHKVANLYIPRVSTGTNP